MSQGRDNGNMYKIMLVDDEIWIRRGLKEQIDWEALQATLSGEASDGEEAYKLAKELKPDIILTDVKMPYMDGLELMELLSKDMPYVKVIVISGYSEFELVQKAMLNKAINYILKPINEKDLNHSISIAIEELRKSKRNLEEKQSLKISLNQSIPALKEKYMNLIISNAGVSNEGFSRIISDLEINFNCSHFQVVAINISNYQSLLTKDFNNDDILLDFAICNIISETFSAYPNYISFRNSTKNYEYVILLGYSTDTASKEASKELKSLLLNVENNLKSSLSAETIAGIGCVYNNVEDIRNSYMEATHALKHMKSKNSGNIMFFGNMIKKDSKSDTLEKIVQYIQEHYSEQITLELMSEKFFINASYLSRAFKVEFGENFIDYVNKIRIEKACRLMSNPVLKNYEISEMVGYENTNYFSKLFKKLTGLSPTEYREQK